MLLLKSSWSTNALLAICLWCLSASLFSCFESKSSLLSLVKKSNRNKLQNSASGLQNLSLNRQKMGGRRRMQMLGGRMPNSMQMFGGQSPNPMYNPYQQAYVPQSYAPQAYQPYGAQYMPQYSPVQAPQLDMSQYGQLANKGGSVMPLAAQQPSTTGTATPNLFNFGRRGAMRLRRPKTDAAPTASDDANLTQADILKATKSADGKTVDATDKAGVAGRRDGAAMARRTRTRSRFQKNNPDATEQPGSTVSGKADTTSVKDIANTIKSAKLDSAKPVQQSVAGRTSVGRKRILLPTSDVNSQAGTHTDKSSNILAMTGSGLNAEVLSKIPNFMQFKGLPIKSNIRQKVPDAKAQGTVKVDSVHTSQALAKSDTVATAATAIEKTDKSKKDAVVKISDKANVAVVATATTSSVKTETAVVEKTVAEAKTASVVAEKTEEEAKKSSHIIV